MSDMMLFSGNATPDLADKIAAQLDVELGKAKVARFSDGEVAVEILENVRGMDVFIIQSTCAPTNESLMELVVMADALRRASAGRITAVVPYFGYARQDRRVRSARVPITAKVVADMMAVVGINRVLTVDLHADQIQGFFDIPVDNVYATPVLIDHIQQNASGDEIVVSPDVGGVVRARAVAKLLNDAELAIIDKRRPEANKSEVMHIIGDVAGRDCIILDDMVDTAGTLCTAAGALKANGAKSVKAYASHPVLSGKAIENINNSTLDKLVVTDTIPLREDALNCDRIEVLTLSEMLAESIRRVNEEESLSSMFMG
ncbi:ribose-phosphate pyrophosphokinase [Aliikangiella marina]|uniref:Ribose-phosphate pyrophosphokinase n=1 Tax=Aliikangiella marina TaxID=1712262 RepID=A0A545TGV7_9GAMM|nr:ribose-phosphate pyrophosphokinase [Aliikangiella marina]TQV76470.1 ribose-phosphate pyrophosphokinase [Aliikangiella marina]